MSVDMVAANNIHHDYVSLAGFRGMRARCLSLSLSPSFCLFLGSLCLRNVNHLCKGGLRFWGLGVRAQTPWLSECTVPKN